MALQIIMKKPKRGTYKVLLSENEKFIVRNGKLRRLPVDKEGLFNSIPLRSITSMKFVESPRSKCSACGKMIDEVLCLCCIEKALVK